MHVSQSLVVGAVWNGAMAWNAGDLPVVGEKAHITQEIYPELQRILSVYPCSCLINQCGHTCSNCLNGLFLSKDILSRFLLRKCMLHNTQRGNFVVGNTASANHAIYC